QNTVSARVFLGQCKDRATVLLNAAADGPAISDVGRGVPCTRWRNWAGPTVATCASISLGCERRAAQSMPPHDCAACAEAVYSSERLTTDFGGSCGTASTVVRVSASGVPRLSKPLLCAV